jgi:hypothetical protein
MTISDKIVITIPLDNIRTSTNELNAQRVGYLTQANIKDLLKRGQVNFILADVGQKLQWIQTNQCFAFWKSEAEQHIVTDVNNINLDNFIDNYAYIASEWKSDDPTPIILLEKIH